MQLEVYVNYDGRYYIKDPVRGVYGSGGHYWSWAYFHYYRLFWFKSSAIRKAKQLEKKEEMKRRRRKFVDQKVWR